MINCSTVWSRPVQFLLRNFKVKEVHIARLRLVVALIMADADAQMPSSAEQGFHGDDARQAQEEL